MYTSYYGTPPTSDEIMHFGVKGMKWGVRRYENPDGTLTQAGKKRYYKYKNDIDIARKSLAESRKARSVKKSQELFQPYIDARKRIANRIYTKDGRSVFREGGVFDWAGSPVNNRRARKSIALTDRLLKNANFDDMPKRKFTKPVTKETWIDPSNGDKYTVYGDEKTRSKRRERERIYAKARH